MYSGTNPIALQSMAWIADALISLMKEYPYKEIVIKQICAQAKLTRRTFYNCFDSKDDVLRWQMCQYLGHYLMPEKNASKNNVEMIAKFYHKAFEAHAEFFHLLIEHAGYLLEQEIALRIQESGPILTNISIDNLNYYNAYLASGLAGILTFWLNQENRISSEQVVLIMQEILSGAYYHSSGIMRRPWQKEND